MLGWFKKKFGKQPAASEAIEPEPSEQASAEEVAVATAPGEMPPEPVGAPPVVESEAPAVVADEPAGAEAVAGAEGEPPMPPAAEEPPVPEPPVPEPPVPEPVAAAAPAASAPEPASEPEAAVVQEPEEAVGAEPAAGEMVEGDVEAVLEPAPSESIVAAEPIAAKTQEKPAAKSLFQRLQERLGKTRDALVYRLDRLFLGKKEIDQELFEQLEEILITADLGVATTLALLDEARKKVKRDQLSDPQALKAIIRDQILAYIEASEQPAELVLPAEGPFVIMVVGVNGVGKTTTIGKLAAKFVRAGQSVLLVAGDTFRAAAINQLRIWGERVGVEVIAQQPGADPSSVVFDGLDHGVAHQHDVIIIDTAGRLHTSVNLMEELKKIKRVIGKKMPGAPHEVMLVLDATTGQNGISQAKLFHQAVDVTGLTLTKLDGTAKGGIVANVCREIKIPVRFIGIGEQIDDLRDFDAREFVDALFAGQEG